MTHRHNSRGKWVLCTTHTPKGIKTTSMAKERSRRGWLRSTVNIPPTATTQAVEHAWYKHGFKRASKFQDYTYRTGQLAREIAALERIEKQRRAKAKAKGKKDKPAYGAGEDQ